MSRRCDLTGKTAQVGHKVSHSNIKTKRRFLPNLLNVTMISDTLGRSVRLRVSATAPLTVERNSTPPSPVAVSVTAVTAASPTVTGLP